MLLAEGVFPLGDDRKLRCELRVQFREGLPFLRNVILMEDGLDGGIPERMLRSRCTPPDGYRASVRLRRSTRPGKLPRSRCTCTRSTAERRHGSWNSFSCYCRDPAMKADAVPRARSAGKLRTTRKKPLMGRKSQLSGQVCRIISCLSPDSAGTLAPAARSLHQVLNRGTSSGARASRRLGICSAGMKGCQAMRQRHCHADDRLALPQELSESKINCANRFRGEAAATGQWWRLWRVVFSEIDRSLLQRCLEGRPRAWEDFVNRFLGLVVHVVNHTARSRSIRLTLQDTEDLTAEVFLAVVNNDLALLRRFRGQSSLATYLTVVARRVVIRELLKRKTTPTLSQAATAAEAPPDAAEQRISDRDEVDRMLQHLRGREADVVRALSPRRQGLSGKSAAPWGFLRTVWAPRSAAPARSSVTTAWSPREADHATFPAGKWCTSELGAAGSHRCRWRSFVSGGAASGPELGGRWPCTLE